MKDISITGFQHPYSLLASGKKLVGWGSGGVFDYFHALFPMPLAYLVDNATNRQGQFKCGFEIRSPHDLKKENPDNLLIIIYSSFSADIIHQLSGLGVFSAINAPVLFCSDYRQQWKKIDHLLDQPTTKKTSCSNKSAIVVQGPTVANLTSKVIALHARQNPQSSLILSTWKDSDSEELKRLEPLIDDLILSSRPDIAGIQNRNLQIVSTQAGLKRCQQLGASYALKTRADMFILAPSIVELSMMLLNSYDPTPAQNWGAHDRLLIPASFTRKYLPYSPSDLAMFGYIDDLSKYWDCPLDERHFDLLSECHNKSLFQLGREGLPAECYFGGNYSRSLGRPTSGELMDSWEFYRDLFLIVDNSWFELFWPKNPHFPDTYPHRPTRQTVSNHFWHLQLRGGLPLAVEEKKIDIKKEFWS